MKCAVWMAAALLACAAEARAGILEGRIVAAEGLVAPPALSVAVDTWACAPDGRVADPSLRIGPQGGLADVVVRVSGEQAPPYAATDAAVIDQRGCAFVPHVIVVAPGQELLVKN